MTSWMKVVDQPEFVLGMSYCSWEVKNGSLAVHYNRLLDGELVCQVLFGLGRGERAIIERTIDEKSDACWALIGQNPQIVRLFERNNGEYFSLHGPDAILVSSEFYKTSSVLKYLGKHKLATCTLSKANAVAFINSLLEAMHRIEIWELRKGSSWAIAKNASPGNVTQVEDLLFSHSKMSASPVVLALQIAVNGDQTTVGIAYTNASSYRRIGVAEFIDNDIFTNLESLLIQLGVKECIVADDTRRYELEKIKALLERCDVVCTETKKADFLSNTFKQDMKRLLDSERVIKSEFDLKLAMSCSTCLIKYLALLSDPSNIGKYSLNVYDLAQYMRLDASAVKALNIMPSAQDGSNKTMSLYGLLNLCKTTQGSRILAQWLKQPLMNISDIEKRQDIVETFAHENLLRHDVREILKKFPDLIRLGKRFQREKANLQDVIRVYQVVICLPELKSSLAEYAGPHEALIQSIYVQPLEEYIAQLEKLVQLVETTVDLDAANHHEYIIKSDFNPELAVIRGKMKDIQQEITSLAEQAARDLGVEYEKKLKYETNAQYGHFLRMSRNDAKCIRGKKGFIELATQKAGVLFTTHEIRELCDTHGELSEAFDKLQRDVVKEVISITGSYFLVLEELNQTVAHLDVLVSFAQASTQSPIPYIRPTISAMGQGDLVLKGSRHPCVELQDGVSFIENDASFVRGESLFQIITGPNMGGKSTYIRQVGVIVLLAQVGCFVPCREAHVPIMDSILARVGAGDSQLKGVSTFMAEMLETTSILKSATANSLVIVDELGRGTSTSDGFGLGWSISEHIASEIRCFCYFATHFHELTELERHIPTVRNLHVQALAQEGTMTLLYKIASGRCDRSFGIHVAEMAQFPPSVVKLAQHKADQLEANESVLSWNATGVNADPENNAMDIVEETGDSQEDLSGLLNALKNQLMSLEGIEGMSPEALGNWLKEVDTKLQLTSSDAVSSFIQQF